MTIREATAADIPRIVEMCLQFLDTSRYRTLGMADPARVASLTETMVAGEGYGVFVAERLGLVFGVAAAQAFDHPMFAFKVASEVVWWIAPEARGGRAAFRLLGALEQWARDAGCEQLHMIAPTAQVGQFYQRRGYEFIESAFARRV